MSSNMIKMFENNSAMRYLKRIKEEAMNADRLILSTDHKGNLKGLPKFPPNKQVEIAFNVIDRAEASSCVRRLPNPDIAGKAKIKGNIFETASENDWHQP